ncbi:MAG: aminoacetone oxidase family FAD-binding enzyme [Oscillibacter sp.]|nr:aminoacetone oxidase family FAD-binding enzyme [Oscillibacter sp.]
MNKKVLVIGGGAAGMMAAITAAEGGAFVTLLEPNERLGKKLNITGKGRCNVTNNAGPEELLSNVPCNGKFLYSAFSRFDGRDTMAFFESLGVPLKTERGNRVFPVSDRAFDISAALERRLRKLKVSIVRDRATALEISSNTIQGVTGTSSRYPAEAVILATGGVSYPATGSTGEGHLLAAAAGHTVTPLRGSLVPLQAAGCAELQGLSLRNVGLAVFENGKKIYTDFGELLFTHFGVSGPLVLSASAHMRHFDKKTYRLEIDLKPALDAPQLDRRLLSDFGKYANHDFGNALNDLLPQKIIPVVVARCGIPFHQKVHDITRPQRETLLQTLKGFSIEIAAPMPETDAIVTSGGIKVGEVNPTTMESKIVKGLYFAGEILDVDAYTGGFNLQIAWATGRAAGAAAAKTTKDTTRRQAQGGTL